MANLTGADIDKLTGITNGTQAANKCVVADDNVNIGVVKSTELHIGASGSETQLTSTVAELNLLDGSSASTVTAGKAVIYGGSGEVNATTLQIAGDSIDVTADQINKGVYAQQVVTVAKAGKDYTSIQSAINSITDAASDKIYTVLVYPGEYDEEITLKNYVNIVAVDPFSTYILRQVKDNGVAVHCNLKINIDNQQTDATHGLYLSAASVVNVVGDITGGAGTGGTGTGGRGIYNNSTETVIVNGNVTGGVGFYGHGIYNNSTGTVIVNGNVTGVGVYGHGIHNNSTGTVIVNGNVTGVGDNGHGIHNAYTGTVIVNGNVTGGVGDNGHGIANYSTGMVRVKNGTISNIGTTATSYPILIYENNSLILENCKIIGVHVDVPAIYSLAAQNVYLMNVYSNRDLHSNITNLISGGFTFDSNVPSP